MGLLREAPSGTLTPATQEAIRSFAAQNGLAATNQVTEGLLNTIRRVIWQTQKWSSGNYKGREKLVDAAGLREAQTLLGKLGFDAGPLDGTFGPQTQVATEAFQESQAGHRGRPDHRHRADEPAPRGQRRQGPVPKPRCGC
jgi:putrescine transport system substrate-binding protein